MAILWCGGEDIDFPIGPGWTSSSNSRTTYARHHIRLVIGNTGAARSLAFPGGAVTSCWLSIQANITAGAASNRLIGLGLSSGFKGIFMGIDAGSGSKVSIMKYDETTQTVLASESGNSIPLSTGIKLDMRVQSYGASGTVDIYLNGQSIPLISYTGNIAVSGMTNMDCVVTGVNTSFNFSEVIVSDEDTRGMSLVTMAPTGAGTTSGWTGLFSDVNEAIVNDGTVAFTNTASLDEQFNVTDLPTGSFSVRMVKVTARAMSATGAATKVGLGVNQGGTVNSGTLQSPGSSFVSLERYMDVNPITGVAWLQSQMNALQLNLRSGT